MSTMTRKKNVKTEARKVVKRIEYFFAEKKLKKRLRVVKLVFFRPEDLKRSKSVEVKLKNTALSRMLNLTKKVQECISFIGESPQGADIEDTGNVLIDIKSSSIQSDDEYVSSPVSKLGVSQRSLAGG